MRLRTQRLIPPCLQNPQNFRLQRGERVANLVEEVRAPVGCLDHSYLFPIRPAEGPFAKIGGAFNSSAAQRLRVEWTRRRSSTGLKSFATRRRA